MRVLVVTTRWDLVGGSERYAGAVVRGLAAAGDEVGVLCARGEQASPAPVLRCAALAAAGLARDERRGLRELARGFAPDVVYLLSRVCADALRVLLDVAPLVRFVQDHTLFCPGLNKLHEDGSACRSAPGPVCLECYYCGAGCSGFKRTGAPGLRFPLGGLARVLRELELTGRARRVLVASQYMRGELLRAGLAPQQVEVLPYFTRPVQAARAARLPAATRAFVEREGPPLLLTPARLTLPDKGIDYLLTAFAELRGRARLVIAGEGPARGWLERKARDEGLEARVHFSGWLGPHELEALYGAASLVLFPSVWDEPFGLVGLEAMAHALPVVAFDVGGVGEWLVHEETGLLCPRRDARALAAATSALLDDPRRAQRLGAAGRERHTLCFSEERHVSFVRKLLR